MTTSSVILQCLLVQYTIYALVRVENEGILLVRIIFHERTLCTPFIIPVDATHHGDTSHFDIYMPNSSFTRARENTIIMWKWIGG